MQTFTIINFVYYFLARIFLAAAGIYNRAFCGGQMHAAQEVQQRDSLSSPGLKRLRHLIKYS